MEILSVSPSFPPGQPIKGKDNIIVCKKCMAVLKFNYEDMWVKHKLGNEINYITCMSCGHEMPVSEVKRDEYKRKQ